MHGDDTNGERAASPIEGDGAPPGRPRLSRRQAIGRMSAVATAGAAAWVVPEILTAKPASGATLSAGVGNTGTGASAGVSTSAGTTGDAATPSTGASTTGTGNSGGGGGEGGEGGEDTGASTTPSTLAFTGLDIKRDAEVGAALVAGGWAMKHWASRTPKPAVTPAVALDGGVEAGSTDSVQ